MQTPSHNTFGIASAVDGSRPAELRCDVQHLTSRAPSAPRNSFWSFYGFTWVLQTRGLNSRNGQGHGVGISRSAQRLF